MKVPDRSVRDGPMYVGVAYHYTLLQSTNSKDPNTPYNHSSLRHSKQREKSYTNLLNSLNNPIPIKQRQKTQVQVQAGNSNKAIAKEKIKRELTR